MKKYRDIWYASGRCINCGAIPDRLGVYCNKCNEQNKLSVKKALQKRYSLRLCRVCSNPLDKATGRICLDCRKKASQKEYERRKVLREKGLCVQCETPSKGFRLCERCRDMKNEARRKQKDIVN